MRPVAVPTMMEGVYVLRLVAGALSVSYRPLTPVFVILVLEYGRGEEGIC